MWHQHLYRVATWLFVIANVAVYVGMIVVFSVAHRSPSWRDVSMWISVGIFSLASLLIGAAFVLYAVLLYMDFSSFSAHISQEQHNQHQQQQQQSKNNTSSELRVDIPNSNSSSSLAPKNPMRKIVYVACVCGLCFVLRTVSLPLIGHFMGDSYDWVKFVLYLSIAEIIPVCLMLFVFDSSGQEQTDQGHQAGRGAYHQQQQHNQHPNHQTMNNRYSPMSPSSSFVEYFYYTTADHVQPAAAASPTSPMRR